MGATLKFHSVLGLLPNCCEVEWPGVSWPVLTCFSNKCGNVCGKVINNSQLTNFSSSLGLSCDYSTQTEISLAEKGTLKIFNY